MHLTITVQSSGAQRLLDHLVLITRIRTGERDIACALQEKEMKTIYPEGGRLYPLFSLKVASHLLIITLIFSICLNYKDSLPIPSAPLFKACVCGSSLAGNAVSNPAGAWTSVCCECCVFSGIDFCDGPFTRPDDSTECVVSESDRKSSTMRRPWPTRAIEP